MKPPFSRDQFYTALLSRAEVSETLLGLGTENAYGGLRKDKFITVFEENTFWIRRKTYGVDGFTLEQYPDIEGIFFQESPLIINIRISPDYFTILFFVFFALLFLVGPLFVGHMTINGVLRPPTVEERLTFVGFGGIIPLLWCYFGYIRPVKKAEKWIIEQLKLIPLNDFYGS